VAVELVARTLGVELVGILELSVDKRVLRLRAGNGWPTQSVNIRAVPLDYCPPLARGINSDVPVHFSRRNFNLIPGLQNDKGSGVVLPIGDKAGRIGVLVVCSDGFRAFSETDINFLRAISFVLAVDAEQRKAAATLRLRDRALEAIGEGIMITDAAEFDNPVIYVNPAFEKLTGYSKEEAAGRNARFLQGAETDKETIRGIRAAVEGEASFRGSVLNYRKDGTPFWNGLNISPIRDPSGTTTHFVGILSDETDRLQLASQLRQAQKMEALGHLTGGVAHDFNNLLAVILGNSEILHDEITDPDLKETAELVMTSAERGADLTQRLLAFGRRQALHPESLELGGVIESLSDMLSRTLGNNVELETHSTAAQLAFIDRSLFESAILNLALNARDAMPNGGLLTILTEVIHSAESGASGLLPGDYVHVTVKDTGEGMPQEVLDRAFDPFFTTKGVGKGSGMGLSMVYGFAKQSGGHVNIESKPGKGTSVHLYLPVSQETEAPKVVEQRADMPTATRNERVLLVEDEPQLRRFVSNQLFALGYSVIEAEAGAPALEFLRKEPDIDLLFTDLLMPGGMSGFDLVEQARKFLPELKVLLTTGYAAETDSMLANVKEQILKKPYKKQQLAQALRSVLDQAGRTTISTEKAA
jgi:PAS domain S-box-containing protein